MVVQPINPIPADDEEKIWRMDELNPLTETSEQAVKETADKVQKQILPKPSNKYAVSTDVNTFFVDKQDVLKEHKAQSAKNARLKNKSSDSDKMIYGQFVDPEDEKQIVQIAANFYKLLRQNYKQEAVTYFRQLSPALQENIGYQLLNCTEFDLEPVSVSLREFYAKNTQISTELRNLAAEKLAEPKRNAFGNTLSDIKDALTEATQLIDDLKEKLPLDKPEFIRREKMIYASGDEELITQYEQVKCYLVDMPKNIRSEKELYRRNGFANAGALASYLDSLAQGAHNTCALFMTQLERYEAAHSKTDFSQMRSEIQNTRDINNQYVAATVRDVYNETQGKIVLKLSEATYLLINESLARLDEPPLSLFFCDLDQVQIASTADLTFLAGNYEYAEQYSSQMDTALKLIVQIFRADAKKMAAWNEEKLEELRKLEEFLEKTRQTLQDFYKKLDDSRDRQKLEIVQIVLGVYARGIHELENNIKNFSLNKTEAIGSTLAKYRVLYEDERWKVIVETLRGSSRA